MASTGKKRSGAWIWVPFAIALILLGAYTAYWYVARGILEDSVDQWIDNERARGAIVEYTEKRLDGFPFRFTLTVDKPIYGEARGPVWRGQELQMTMQPWDWYHVIARSPGRNTVALEGGEAEDVSLLLGAKSAGSLRWNPEGVIERISLSLDEASLAMSGDPLGALDDFEFHLRQVPSEPETLQLETHWQRVVLEETPPDEAAFLGREIGPSILRAELEQGASAYARSGDLLVALRHALNDGGALLVPQVLLEWGPASLGAKADLSREAGELRGAASVRIERADELRAALATQGLLTDETRQAIDALEAASTDGGFFTTSLRGDGVYFLGNKIADLPLEDIL
ncbi:MAG: DUF2125 domain-containing protein [Pseudomonadota bacterium]